VEQIILSVSDFAVPVAKITGFIKANGAGVTGNDGVDETVVALQFPGKC